MICKKFNDILNTIKRILLIFIITPCNKCQYYNACELKNSNHCKDKITKLFKIIKDIKESF